MKKISILLLFSFVVLGAAFFSTKTQSQIPVYSNVIFVSAAPTGACTNGAAAQIVVSTGVVYTCQSSTWSSTTATVSATIPVATYCGTTGTCSPVTLTNPMKFAYGRVTLAAGTATVSSIPAFTSTTNMSCSCEDTTATLQACNVLPATTSSVTANGNTTDTIEWSCWGN